MNMKKALAGLMAGIVAISAMATVAVSAKAQEAGTRVFDTYQYDYSVVTSLKFGGVFTSGTAVTKIDISKIPGADVLDNITIKSATIAGNKVVDEELDLYVTKLIDTGKTYIQIGKTGADSTLKAFTVVIEVKDTDDIAGNDYTKDTAKKARDKVNDDPKIDDGAATPGNVGIITVKNENGVAQAGTAAANVEAGSAKGSISAKVNADQYYLQLAAKTTENVGGKEVMKDDVWVDIGEGTTDANQVKSASFIGARGVDELNKEIANTLAGNRGAVLTFYFQDKREKEEDNLPGNPDYSQDTGWNDGEYTDDFAIRVNGSKALTGVGKVDAKNNAISFDWDTVLAKSDLLNSAGQVYIEIKANTDDKSFLYDKEYDKEQDKGTFAYEITKIEVKWPAAEDGKVDMEEFAAGESATVVEDTLPAATDAPATTDAPAATTAATDGAANPETGNSAVALLAIPAALAAAAIVAKKRG